MHDPTHPPRTWQLLSTTWPSVWAIGRGERERGLHRTNSAVSTGAGPSACMIAISPVSPWCGGSWDGRQHALGARFDPNPMSKRDMAGKQKTWDSSASYHGNTNCPIPVHFLSAIVRRDTPLATLQAAISGVAGNCFCAARQERHLRGKY